MKRRQTFGLLPRRGLKLSGPFGPITILKPRHDRRSRSFRREYILAAILLAGLAAIMALPDAAYIALVFGPPMIVLLWWLTRRGRRQAAIANIDRAVDAHLDVLARKRRQLVHMDSYGRTVTESWERELKSFAENMVHREGGSDPAPILGAAYLSTVIERVERKIVQRPEIEPDGFTADMPGTDYERFCGKLLAERGWHIEYTQASRDQGVDIIAHKEITEPGTGRAVKRTIVLQCKRQQARVGNGAVQEVATGRLHYGADLAIVVSNAAFTRPAAQLAATSGVLLLHHEELARFEPTKS